MKPRFRSRSASTALCAILCLSPSALAGGVRIVDATGARNFPDIQSAIDAAVGGDVLLVGAGSYPGFTLDGKSLSIFAAPPGAPVSISTGVTVRNVSGSCVLAGFSVGPPTSPNCGLGLSVRDCSGIVAFEDCVFRGTEGHPIGYPCGGWTGAEIRNCAAVVLSGCGFEGGMGASFLSPGNETGGHGCSLDSSTVAAYGCTFRGGEGGTSYSWSGDGGDGVHAVSSWMFASGGSFLGGAGGNGTSPSVICGTPGTGLVVDLGSSAHLLQPTAAGGAGGSNCIPSGSAGPYGGAGSFDFLPGTARSFDIPSLSVDRAAWNLSVAGVPRDQVFLNRSLAPVFHYEPALSGVCTSMLPPFPPASPLGVVPPSGNLEVEAPQRRLPDSTVAQLHFLQGYSIDPAGTVVLGSPMHVLSLNWNSPPDWNGNGVNDYAEVITGTTADANHDLIPDTGGVRIVDATGARNFRDIQSAITAAVDGDVLLVGAASYPGFTLDGKGLSIFAVPAGTQGVSVGDVTVRNVLDKTAVLCGLSGGMLTVDNCSGYVAFQDCSFSGTALSYTGLAAGNVSGSVEIVFSGCTFAGRDSPPCGACSWGTPGGDGLHIASSTIAAYGCTIRGGKGADCCTDTANGGVGGVIYGQAWTFAAACSFIGGDSGNGTIGCLMGAGTWCGAGGDGLQVYGELHALSDGYAGGQEGSNCCPWLGAGGGCVCTWTGGACDFLPGSARSFHLPYLSVDRAPWSMMVAGVARDQVFLNRSLAPVFQYEPALSGVCTSKLPPFPVVSPLGVVPLSGSLTLDVRQRLLPDSVVAQLYFLQGYVVDPAGATTLGSPLHVLSLNWNSLPDCNGNGINDYAEVIAGVTVDANHDLIPDSCP